jgi:deazaflavin-dependent oxidoreductase (nitroreductase family)
MEVARILVDDIDPRVRPSFNHRVNAKGNDVHTVAADLVHGDVLPKVFHKLTGGRWTPSMLQVPSLMLTTTGAKSGEPRTVPLACLPDGDGFYLVGSNFGQERHPAWSGNLLADPHATVTVAGVATPVVATLADADERTRLLPTLLAVWPGYDDYAGRTDRELRVFRLARA